MMTKLTKTQLRIEQERHTQLKKYLPTLQLKKMLLQQEVAAAEVQIEEADKFFRYQEDKVRNFSKLFSDKNGFDLFPSLKIIETQISLENIAGVDVPIFQNLLFQSHLYYLADAPLWIDGAIRELQLLLTYKEKKQILEKKKKALEKELRDISIRVNLFEKILIPRAIENIRKIKNFLGDQLLSAIAQAKIAKSKLILKE